MVLMLGLSSQLSAQVDLSRLSPQQLALATTAMTPTLCTCGCELTVAACLIDDPSCDVSPAMAQAIIEEIVGAAGAGLVSDQAAGYQRLAGQQLVYISWGPDTGPASKPICVPMARS